MNSDFVNRKQEFSFFRDWVNSNHEQNEGIFVYSKSGIGKSRLMSELLCAEFSDHVRIRVEMINSERSAVESYSYLKHLYREVIKTTETDSTLPLAERVSLNPSVSLAHIGALSVTVKNEYGFAEEIAHIMDYLERKLLWNNSFVIDIENFHLVDSESMECLIQLFGIGKCHRYIFEFTMDPSNIPTYFYHLFNRTSAALKCRIYELKKLRPKELDVLCERNSLPVNIARDLYQKNDGNLFPIIMLPYSSNDNTINPLVDIIDCLGHDQRIIMFLLELFRGEASIKTVQQVFELGRNILTGSRKYSKSYIESQFKELKRKKIIKINNQILRLTQDQLLEIIQSYHGQPNYYLAWTLFENYHYVMFQSLPLEKRESHILDLLHAYSIFPDIRLYSILPDLTIIILQNPPDRLIEKVNSIRIRLEINDENRKFVNYLNQYLADICIASGQWHEALNQIKDHYSEDIPWQACYLAASMAANPQLTDAEDRISRMRMKHKGNLVPYMSITVSLLSFYLRTMPELKVKTVAENYLKEFKDYQNLNYAFLLKLYSNTQPNDEAITTLESCNSIFREYQREDLVVMNMITIASRKVYMGYPDVGLAMLNEIEQRASEQHIPIRHQYLLNNRSAINLIMGTYDERTQKDLTTAFYSTESSFEKAIILCNLMIYYILSDNLSEADKKFQQIRTLELTQYNNVDLDFIILKNTLFYYETMDDLYNISRTRNKLVEFAMSEECPTDIKVHALSLIPQYSSECKSLEAPFLSRYKYQADFIGYWQCEVCYETEGRNHLKSLMESQGIKNYES